MNVVNVERLSVISQLSLYTRELIQKKSPINVMNVESLSV